MFQHILSESGYGRVHRQAAAPGSSRRRRRNRLRPRAESLEVRDCPSGAASHLGFAETAHALVAVRHAEAHEAHEIASSRRAKQRAPQTIYVAPSGKTGASAGKNARHPLGSLNVAFSRAKAGATIILAPGVYTQIAGMTGKSNITIDGAAGGSSILAGSGNYALKVYTSSGITINNVSFRSPNGSGLAVYGSSVNLTNVKTDGSHTDGVVVSGGGILNATSSQFNSVQTGDGLDVQSGTATLDGCTFNSNGNGGQSGGGTGLSVEGTSQVTVTNSQLSGNMNTNLVAFNQAQVSAQGDTFSNSQQGDGAIFSGQTTVNLTGNTFASNGTTPGPTSGFNGIEFYSDFTGSATITGNTFSDNTASGLFISSTNTSQAMQITGNTFTGNFVGLNMDASVSPIDAVIQGNTFSVDPGSSYQGLVAAGSNDTATIGGSGSAQNVFENYAYQSSILQFHISSGKTIGCPNLSIATNSYFSGGNAVSPDSAILPC
jgi:hypothetical protein